MLHEKDVTGACESLGSSSPFRRGRGGLQTLNFGGGTKSGDPVGAFGVQPLGSFWGGKRENEGLIIISDSSDGKEAKVAGRVELLEDLDLFGVAFYHSKP